MILEPVKDAKSNNADPVNLRCPNCRREVAAQSLGFPDARFEAGSHTYRTGQRVCTNSACRAHVFVVLDYYGDLVASYPAETIDFDSSDVPTRVVAAFEEAIKCHAQGCYTAGARMVRKTLEEICADRGAAGDNLKKKIEALGDKVVLPKALLAGLDELRLLGNDAAHVESRLYEQVGQAEVEVAIDVAKEILKSTYQYEGILGRLQVLKKDHEGGS